MKRELLKIEDNKDNDEDDEDDSSGHLSRQRLWMLG